MEPIATRFWLTDVMYLEGKRAIAVQFSRLNIRKMVRIPFFPSFYISKEKIGFAALQKMLLGKKSKFRIWQKHSTLQVVAATFYELNNLADALFKETGFRPIVLRPERQFLLERGWGYLDCFSFFSEKEFVKSDLFSMPKAKLRFFSEPLHETMHQLAKEDPLLAEKIIESIALSNVLRMPINDLPSDALKQQQAMLENLLWSRGLSSREKERRAAGLGKSKLDVKNERRFVQIKQLLREQHVAALIRAKQPQQALKLQQAVSF